jgi:hypothetical protein
MASPKAPLWESIPTCSGSVTVDACVLPATTTDRSSIGQAIVTIDILPDDVLLEIFTVYLGTGIQVEHNDRVCQIVWDAQGPFQVLTDLRIIAYHGMETVLPEELLGGSAPRLRSCDLCGIAFPGIWKLLLAANYLVIFLILGTFPPRRACPRRPISKISRLDSNPLDLAQTKQIGALLRPHALSSPLSPAFVSKASASTSKTLSRESASLYSTTPK